MPPRRLDRPSFFLSLLLLVGGLGMLAAAVAIAASFGQAEVQLRRDAESIHGSIRWVFCGLPIFWRSLDGLERVDRADYETTVDDTSAGRSSSSGQTRTVARASFRGAEGRELAWAERTAIINEIEHIQRFLAGGEGSTLEAIVTPATSFEFKEPAGHWNWERIKTMLMAAIILPLLLGAGLLCVVGGSTSLWRWLVPAG